MAEESFFVRSRGKVTGPFDLAGLQRLVRLGMLSRVHELSADKQNWLPASRTPGLFPDAGAAGVGAAHQSAVVEEDFHSGYGIAENPPPAAMPMAASVSTPTTQCVSCGGIFPAAQVYLDRGRNLCLSCFQKQAAPEENAGADSKARGSYRGMAVASMVLGICGLVILLVGVLCTLYLDMHNIALGTGIVISSSCAACAALAVVLGAAAWRGNGQSGGRSGTGMAIAGFIMGLVMASGYVIYGAVFLAISLAAVAAAHRF